MTQDESWPRLHPARRWPDDSDAKRGDAVEAACRTAMQLLQDVPDRERYLARLDPVPRSTRALLRRLASRSRHV